ncbi:MAG: relaxase/mobilization nuclease domain-containing protein, partial [Oscillospiraceae bacterium]|nr:relaxase/mobilization nuclease domain-containing protein [Oscillospiraceae bacterium]
MAVTSIWPITGNPDGVIEYAINPEKTSEESREETAALHAIDNVVEYTADDLKTEKRMYVSSVNCQIPFAKEQFMETKRRFGKMDGRTCYHGYQSFRAGEVDADTAHRIGVELAKELWGDRFEVVVATHLNTDHYHNHFVINSVSSVDGRKFSNRKPDYARMREVSDRLCKEHHLSVIKDPQWNGKS